MKRIQIALAAVVLLAVSRFPVPATAGGGDGGRQIDAVMFSDPALHEAKVKAVIPASLKALWLKALQRPEDELARVAADTIAIAQGRGMQGLDETRDKLAEVLSKPDHSPLVRRAAAHALVVLDARDKADLLARHAAAAGMDMALVVEPALARWKHEPSRAAWRKRLDNPSTPRASLLLAIDGLGVVGDRQATPSLLRIAVEPGYAVNIRVSAARALAEINESGLVEDARKLAGDKSQRGMVGRILAVALLERHSDPQAIGLLKQLVDDKATVVAARALTRLLAIDPGLVFEHAEQAVASTDVNVRWVGARSLVAKSDGEAVRMLGPLMDDQNPSLRRFATSSLIELAGQPELEEEVIDQAMQMLADERWRGAEQAAVALARLDHEPAAPRLVELLEHERAEVFVAAAWALRCLQVETTLPAMLNKADRIHSRLAGGSIPDSEIFAAVQQISHLFQAFGLMRYRESITLLRKYVPKEPRLGIDSRTAAVWALGYLYENQAPEDLTAQLVQRLLDADGLMPESPLVRRMAAVSLGRMKSESALPQLRRIMRSESGTIPAQASAWAVQQLTGEPPPPVPTMQVRILNWFLVPAR